MINCVSFSLSNRTKKLFDHDIYVVESTTIFDENLVFTGDNPYETHFIEDPVNKNVSYMVELFDERPHLLIKYRVNNRPDIIHIRNEHFKR